MKNTLETRLGIFVALAVIAAVLILETVGGIDMLRRGRTLTALFGNVQELKVGDRVKMAGVEIGRIQDVALTNNKVLVTMKLHKDAAQKVKTDSKATVKFTGLMGQNFVAISFGSPGAPIARENTPLDTEEQADLDSLYNSTLTTVTNLQDIGADVKLALGDARKVVDQVNSTMAEVSAGHGTIGKLLKDETVYNNVADASASLKEILQKINQGNGTVGKLINDQEFYRNAKVTLQKLDQATEGLEDQGPLSVLGAVVGKLF